MMDAMASMVHLKLKYHNVYDELTTIYVDLLEAWKIHKDLHHIQKGKDKEKAMEINMVFLTRKLNEMMIKLSKESIRDPIGYYANNYDLIDVWDDSE